MNAHGQLGSSRSVARNAAFRTVGEVVAKLASVVFFVALARELGERGFGDFMFALSFTTVLLIGSGFGTEELLAREVARDRRRLDDLLSNVVVIKMGTSVVLLGVAAAFVNLAGYSADARSAVYLVGAGVAVENLGRSWHSVLQAFERMELISISLILQRVVTAAAGVAVLAGGGGIVGVSLVFLAGSVLGFLTAWWALRRFLVRPRLAVARGRWWPIVKSGAPIGLATLLFTVLLKVDQTLISFLSGGDNREVGFYGAAFRLIEATMFISWSFTAAMLPWLARRGSEDRAGVARGYEVGMKSLTAVLLPLGVALAVLADPVIEALYGARYEDAVMPLRYLAVMTVFYGLNALAVTVLVARDRPMEFSRILAVVIVLNLALNLALIPPYGATGAAFAAAVSSIVLAALGARRITTITGRLRTSRALAGPAVAGAAMAGAMLATGLALLPAALLGGAVYVLVVVGVERVLFPDDLRLAAELLRRRRAEPAPVTPAPFEAG